MEVDPGGDLSDEDERDDQVDACAERWPPTGVDDEVVALLPQVLEAVPDVSDDKQPRGSGEGHGGEQHEDSGDHNFDDDDARAAVGNTGGANVNALQPMPIPDDLQAVLNGP